MTKYKITMFLEDGTVTETIRHTFKYMGKYVADCLAQGDVARYIVEEIRY